MTDWDSTNLADGVPYVNVVTPLADATPCAELAHVSTTALALAIDDPIRHGLAPLADVPDTVTVDGVTVRRADAVGELRRRHDVGARALADATDAAHRTAADGPCRIHLEPGAVTPSPWTPRTVTVDEWRDAVTARRRDMARLTDDDTVPDVVRHSVDQYDGGTWMLATHVVDQNGDEVLAPSTYGADHVNADGTPAHGVWVHVGAVAQPADPRMTRRDGTTWRHGAAADDGTSPLGLADGARAERQSTTAVVGPDRYNLTVTHADGTEERRTARRLTADGARWLHAVAGTPVPDVVASANGRAIVGALIHDGALTRRRERHVVVDFTVRQHGAPDWRNVAPRDAVPDRGDIHHGTAREVVVTSDARTERERREVDPTRAARHAESRRVKRAANAVAGAATVLSVGKPVTGRRNAGHVVAMGHAVAIALLGGWTVTPSDIIIGADGGQTLFTPVEERRGFLATR